MDKLKYIFIAILLLASYKASALSISYVSIESIKGSNVLLQDYGIGNKANYICNIASLDCSPTKKQTLGTVPSRKIKRSLQKELKDKKAQYITFSPSGKLLAYYLTAEEPSNSRTYIIKNLKNNKEYSFSNSVSYWDLIADGAKVFAFSPNSKTLGYLDDKTGFASIYLINTENISTQTVEGVKLATSAYTINNFIFGDNQTIYYIGNEKANPYIWSLHKFNLKNGKDIVIQKDVSYTNSIIKVGSSLIFYHLTDNGYAPEIYNISRNKLQFFNLPGEVNTNTNALAHQEVVKIGESYGVLMDPNNYDPSKTYPLLIWLHGGPYRQTSYGYHPFHSYGIYDSILELLRKNNVLVLKLDYIGSLGFGRSYAESIKGSVGKGDITDVMNTVAYMKNRSHIDNVYLAGNSYGGYMSLKALAEHPEAFTGVISINGVTDWESLLVKMKNSIFNTQFEGLPNSGNQALYDQASIINKIGNIGNQKIEIIQGQADRTIAPWQADLLYNKLTEQNKNVSIIKYAGEDHVFKEKKNISDLCSQMFNFMNIPIDQECNN